MSGIDFLMVSAAVSCDDSDELQAALLSEALLFLSAGGRLTLHDWSLLSKESKQAFCAASKRLQDEYLASSEADSD